jgi:long-chain acyl-CoA synthetase
MEKMTINEMLSNSIRQYGSKAALSRKIDGSYEDISYDELGEQVENFTLGLVELGIERGDRVVLLSENRPEWAITDLAIIAAGGVNVPMFPTLTSAQVEYIVKDSGAKVVCVSNEDQLKKVEAFRENVSHLERVIVFDATESDADGQDLSFEQVCDLGKKVENGTQIYQEVSGAANPEDLVTIIYTSGTTGDPKGAMLTHHNFMFNARACLELVAISHEDVLLSFLPLSHVFERMAGHYLPLTCGSTIAYAESPFTVAQNLGEVRPTLMASVPRLYETMHDRILRAVKEGSPIKQKIFGWGVKTGQKVSQAIQAHKEPSFLLNLKMGLANKLVFGKILARVGGRLKFFVSGGAALPQSIAEFFHAAGILILEGYGLTETSPVISVNSPNAWKFGTVGKPIPGVEVKIADDGEILSKGPHIMQGYYNRPEDTAEAIDSDGWFHTGDIGQFDEDGFLKITDRKKNILVLSNGKNVAPQPIESELVRSEYISQVMLIGDGQKSVAALVAPSFDALEEFGKEHGLDTGDNATLVETKEVRQLIRGEINRLVVDFADFERPRMFAVISREFTQEDDEMTPTLKLKRQVILDHFSDEINAIYGEDDAE